MSKENKFHLLTLIIAIIMLLVFSVDVYAEEYPIYGYTLYSGEYIGFTSTSDTGLDHNIRYDNCVKYGSKLVIGGNTLEVIPYRTAGTTYDQLRFYYNGNFVNGSLTVDIDGDGQEEQLNVDYKIILDGLEDGYGLTFEHAGGSVYIRCYLINNSGDKYIWSVGPITSAIDIELEPYVPKDIEEADKEQIDDFITYQSYYGKEDILRIGWEEATGHKAVYIAMPSGANWQAYEDNTVGNICEYWFECESGYSILWPNGVWDDYLAGANVMLTDKKIKDGENPINYYEGEGEYFSTKINVKIDGRYIKNWDYIRLGPGEIVTQKLVEVDYQYRNMEIESCEEEEFQVEGISYFNEYCSEWNKNEYGRVNGKRNMIVTLRKGEVYDMTVCVVAGGRTVLKTVHIRVIGSEEKVDMDNDGYDDDTGDPMPDVLGPPSGGVIGYLKWIAETMYNGIVGVGDTIGKIFGSIKPLVEGVGMMVSWLPAEVQSLLILSVSIGFLLMLIGR